MNIQNLERGHFSNLGASLRDRLGNAYERIAAGADYQRNENNLRIIQAAVVTVSAIATASRTPTRIGTASATMPPSA